MSSSSFCAPVCVLGFLRIRQSRPKKRKEKSNHLLFTLFLCVLVTQVCVSPRVHEVVKGFHVFPCPVLHLISLHPWGQSPVMGISPHSSHWIFVVMSTLCLVSNKKTTCHKPLLLALHCEGEWFCSTSRFSFSS